MKLRSIRRKLLALHLVIALLLIIGMGISSYQSQWQLSRQISTQYHTDISQRFIGPVSLAIAGDNYSNITLPVFTDELYNLPSLLYMRAEGLSNYHNRYAISYHREERKVRRNDYPDDYEAQLQEKINRYQQLQAAATDDAKKLEFLINRAREDLYKQGDNRAAEQRFKAAEEAFRALDSNRIDTDRWRLKIVLETGNQNGGEITLIYDVSSLKSIREEIISHGLFEMLIATLFCLPLLWLVGRLIVTPIESLAKYISSDFGSIDPKQIPATQNNDEVGHLAKRFQALVIKANDYIEEIEALSITDSLTGLYNRHFYNKTIETLIGEALRADKVLSFLYIDIDNFKKYNDHYGHSRGDSALKQVAAIFKQVAHRKSDFCFRLGGEEFLLIIETDSLESSSSMAERVREAVEAAEIEHHLNDDYRYVTVSIGICSLQCRQEGKYLIAADHLLTSADQELYRAKRSGRNRVSIATINCLDPASTSCSTIAPQTK